MGEKNNTLTPDIVQKLSSLTDVRKISDLEEKKLYDVVSGEINTSNEFIGSYLVTSTFLNDRYYNFRIKLQELTNYLREIGGSELISFKREFDYFINQLKENTQNSYVQFIPTFGEDAVGDEIYSYTFNYKLSQIQDDYIPFSYADGDSTYAYTNALTDGLVTSDVLEEYVRSTIGRILGVPNTPAAVSEAIDSIIEFVNWFKDFQNGANFTNLIDQEHNTLVFGKTTYTLVQNDLGQIGFIKSVDNYNYTSISLTLDSPSNATQSLEIDSPSDSLTLKAHSNKNCEVTESQWNGVNVGAQYNANTTITSSGNQYTSNTTTKFKLKVKDFPTSEDIAHGHNGSTSEKEVIVQFNKYRVWIFQSSDANFSVSLNNMKKPTNIPSNTIYNDILSEFPSGGFSLTTNTNGYIYILIYDNFMSSNVKFYFGSESQEQKNPIEYPKLYSTEAKYTLYRSQTPQVSGLTIRIIK